MKVNMREMHVDNEYKETINMLEMYIDNEQRGMWVDSEHY